MAGGVIDVAIVGILSIAMVALRYIYSVFNRENSVSKKCRKSYHRKKKIIKKNDGRIISTVGWINQAVSFLDLLIKLLDIAHKI